VEVQVNGVVEEIQFSCLEGERFSGVEAVTFGAVAPMVPDGSERGPATRRGCLRCPMTAARKRMISFGTRTRQLRRVPYVPAVCGRLTAAWPGPLKCQHAMLAETSGTGLGHRTIKGLEGANAVRRVVGVRGPVFTAGVEQILFGNKVPFALAFEVH